MARQLVLRPEKCVNCRTCELVCSFRHTEQFNPTLSAVTVFNYEREFVTVPVMCLQCEEASCMKVCPTGAIRHNALGVAEIDRNRCLVCKLCVTACSMGNMSYSPLSKQTFKCDLCGGEPECVKHCAAGALLFEEAADDKDHKRAVANRLRDAYAEEVA